MQKYDVILFDLDDTLINNFENSKYAFKQIIKYIGKTYFEEDFIKWLEFDEKFWYDFNHNKIIIPKEYQSPRELILEYARSLRYKVYFNHTVSIEESFIINELFSKSLSEKVVPIEGVYETLEYLYNKYKLVIASNGSSSTINSKLEKINCLKFINNIFTVDMTKKTTPKPNINFFEDLKDHINFYDNSRMLLIGDSLFYEVHGGMNAGIDTCWFNPSNKELPKEYQPTLIISTLSELKNKL